ncbi:MAG: PD-(D/E)XK nuclease family protein [Actinomycetota bacterium]|nr:PD-(D/E)XK nuclease family protein [Actinomycetota bacterium]
MIQEENVNKILSLVHDPLFAEFELEREAPSIFNAVGRTYTETWHSALLGWLLDPHGSHSLGTFALMRLLLLLESQDSLPEKQRGVDLGRLLTEGDFSNAEVRPNERHAQEVSVADMRFDVLVEGIMLKPWNEVRLLVEIKVKAPVSKVQNQKYIDYITKRRQNDNVLTVPVYIAPASKLRGTAQQTLGDESWLAITYQEINDEIIEPCSRYPTIAPFGRSTLSEYTKTLKYTHEGGEPLAITQKERDIVSALMAKHEPAVRALYDILSQDQGPGPLPSAGGTARSNIKIQIGTTTLEESSVPKLYKRVLEFLDKQGCLKTIQLPLRGGPTRYLIARSSAINPDGRDFISPVEHNGIFMETNYSRQSALNELPKLLSECGLQMQVLQ